jgi:hypothetical protein
MKPVLLVLTLICALFLSLSSSPAYAQGKLKKMEKEVEGESSKGTEGKIEKVEKEVKNKSSKSDDDDDDRYDRRKRRGSSRTSSSSNSSSNSESDWDPRDMGRFFKGLFTGAWPSSWKLHNQNFWSTGYAPYPYSSPYKGRYLHANGNRKSVSVTGHYFRESRELRGYSVWSRFSPSPFYSVEAHITGLTETLRHSDDHLAFYDVYVNYQRVRHENVAIWFGAGVKTMQGEDTYYGPAATTGLEIYPGSPISLYGMINVGGLNARAVWETQVRLNIHANRGMFYAGYQRIAVGRVAIRGIVAGMGLHF